MKVSGIVALLLLFACASTSWSAPFPMQMLPGHVVVDTSNAASLHTNSAKVNRTLPTPDTPSVKHRVLLSEPPRPNPQSNSKSSEEPAATPAAVVNGLKPHSKNPVLFDLSHLDGSGFFTEPDFWEKAKPRLIFGDEDLISPSQIDKLFDLPLIDVPLSPPPSKNINASATLDESTVNIDDQQRPANHIPITPAPTAPHDPTMLYTSVHFAHDPLTWNDASTYFMTPYSSFLAMDSFYSSTLPSTEFKLKQIQFMLEQSVNPNEIEFLEQKAKIIQVELLKLLEQQQQIRIHILKFASPFAEFGLEDWREAFTVAEKMRIADKFAAFIKHGWHSRGFFNNPNFSIIPEEKIRNFEKQAFDESSQLVMRMTRAAKSKPEMADMILRQFHLFIDWFENPNPILFKPPFLLILQ